MDRKIRNVFLTLILMIAGLVFLKFIPMEVYGYDILFDASAHFVIVAFVLYAIYFFIDQNKSWRIPYFVFAFVVLGVVSIQRININAHNDIGLLLGLLIVVFSIGISHWMDIRGKIDF